MIVYGGELMKRYFRFLGLIIILLTAGYFFIVYTVAPDYISKQLPLIEQQAQGYINGQVKIGRINWGGGLTVELEDIEITDSAQGKVAELPHTLIKLEPWRAISHPLAALGCIELDKPVVYLTMNNEKQWNMQNLLKPSESDETPFYGLLKLKGGSLEVTMPQGQWRFGVDGSVSGHANPDFALDTKIAAGSDVIELKGLVTMEGKGKMSITSDSVKLAPYQAVVKEYTKIDNFEGAVNKLRLLYDNNGEKIRYSGEAQLASLKGTIEFDGAAHSIFADGIVKAADSIVTIASLEAGFDDEKLHFTGEVDLQELDNPSGTGLITAEKLTYAGFSVANLSLPIALTEEELQLQQGVFDYGGGRITANGSYALEEKLLAADVSLANVGYEVLPGEVAHANGTLAIKADASGENVAIEAAADTFDLGWKGVKISKLALDGNLDDNGLNIRHFSAFSGKGTLAADGTIHKDGTLAFKGRMAEFPIDPFLDLINDKGGTGLCSTGFDIGGTINAPEFSGMVQLSEVRFMEQNIKEAHGLISLKNNILGIDGFKANMEQGYHLIDGSINLQGKEPVFDVTVETHGVRIEPLMRIAAPDVSVTGNLNNIVQITGPLSNPTVYGEVLATDGSAMDQLYTSVAGRYTYVDKALGLNDFVINAFYAKVTLDGKMSADNELHFTMDARNVDLAHLPIDTDDVALAGLVNAHGQLSGTLTKPFFRGDIDSDLFTINGESITELKGSLSSNGHDVNKLNVTFKQPYKDNEVGYGLYSADLNLNIPAKYMKGELMTMWGDIGGLLRMCRQDYDINGYMQGKLDINPKGIGSGIDINITADNVTVHKLPYHKMNFNGRLQKGVLYFDDVKLQEQENITDRGIIAVGGKVDFKERQYGIEIGAFKANPAIVTAVMKDPPEITGEADLLLQISGSFDNPMGVGSLEIVNGAVSGVGMDRVIAMLELNNDNIHLSQFIASKDIYSLKAEGDIPVDLFRLKEERRNPNAEMKIEIDMDEARLGMLPAMTPLVEWGVGDTKGKITLAGTLEQPLLYGNVKLDTGSIKLKDIDTVMEDIHLDLAFDGTKVLLNDVSAKLGKGKVAAMGSYTIDVNADEAYSLKVTAADAEIESAILKGRFNGEMEIIPQKYRDYASQKGNKAPPERVRPLIKGNIRLDDVLLNMPTIPELGEGSSNFGLDVAVELGPKIHMFNSYLYDIWLSGRVQAKGSTLFPVVDGIIKAEKGTVTYLRTNFKLEKASLVWVDVGTFLPNVNLESTARFSRYNINMRINGPVENMDLQLTSNPPLPSNTIIRMLTLQRDNADGGNSVTGEDINNLMTAGLQMTVLGDVEMLIKQTLGLDQFRVYTGKVRAGIGFEGLDDKNRELTEEERNQYNILVSKYLTNKFLVGYTTSFDGIDRSVFGQYDISRHLSLTYTRSYELDNDPDDWYGLEYKVTF